MKTKLLIIDVSCINISTDEDYGCYRFVTFDDQSEQLLNNYISSYDQDCVDESPMSCVIKDNQGTLRASYDVTGHTLEGLKMTFDVYHTVVFDNNMLDKCKQCVGYPEIISRYCDLTDFFEED